MSALVAAVERAVKRPIWGCRMCGQCVLHATGLTCAMTCPKNMRNGPCGGVLQNGHCEVEPHRRCTWVQAWQRSARLPLWREQIAQLRPPVDWRLEGTSSWENLLTGRDRHVPAGWAATQRPMS